MGVSVDAPERNLAWTRELRLPFRLLSDPDGAAARRWGAWDDTWRLARRVTYIVDARGRIRWSDEGGVAIDTSRTLDALERLARER